jgi:hypothetical protein
MKYTTKTLCPFLPRPPPQGGGNIAMATIVPLSLTVRNQKESAS